VRRSTRNHNDGFFFSLPDKSSRKKGASTVKATAPAVLQIVTMRRVGVQMCNINPDELTEDKLMQERST
jgi:hypothetical protein